MILTLTCAGWCRRAKRQRRKQRQRILAWSRCKYNYKLNRNGVLKRWQQKEKLARWRRFRWHDAGLTALKSVNPVDGLTADRNEEDEETGPLSVCVFWTAGAPNPWLWTTEPLCVMAEFFPEIVSKETKITPKTPTEQFRYRTDH